eukprot:1186308-Prorocentrum_minimum.AAC.2
MHARVPRDMMAMRSLSMSASSMKCVVSTTTRPVLLRRTTSHVKRRLKGSMPEVGSSRNTTCRRGQDTRMLTN